MAARVEINNPNSYKKCSKKSYEVYVCMPPKGTVIINKLEQADVVKALNGKTYFTVEDLNKMQKNGDARFNIISQVVNSGRAYLVSDKTPFVLCGTVGEMWTISADKLASTYTFLQGGQPVSINQQTLNQRLLKDGLLNWTLIRISSQATMGQNMACFVPTAQKCQIQTSWGAVLNVNGAGVKHGKGDFIVCSMTPDRKPNLADRWVVNGEIFATTYNNQGWTDCIAASSTIKNITIADLPNLLNRPIIGDNKAYNATLDAMIALGFKDSWIKLNTIPQFKSHPERFFAVLQILNRYKNQHKDVGWKLDDYRFIDEDSPIFNIQLDAKSRIVCSIVLEYRYNVNRYYFYGWYGTLNNDPCECYLSGNSLDALYSSFCKAVNDMKESNRHGDFYFDGLSSDAK